MIKRVYDKPSVADGARVLVDRLWPRGISKENARLDAWLRDLAPSDALRKWFHSRPAAWEMFKKRYLAELNEPVAAAALQELYDLARRKNLVTLLFASRNQERNNATVLRDLIEGMRKPPLGSGPAAAAAVVRRRAVRRK